MGNASGGSAQTASGKPAARRYRWALVFGGLALVGGLLAWLWLGSKPTAPSTVILISVDTLRADHMGCYGYKRPTSPTLDALAAEGLLFEDVSSPSPWTLPAHASLLTGLYPSRHGLKSHTRYLPASVPTLAALLSRRGYVTAAVVNSHNLSPRFGLDRGFQEFLYVEETADQRAPSTRITDQAIEWLERYRGRPLFLFIHYYDVHSDYRSLPEYEKRFVAPYEGSVDGTTAQLIAFRNGKGSLDARDAAHLIDLYDAGIRQMDDELGRLLKSLQGKQALEDSLLIVTSDHGEEFLERGGVLHGRTQFQEVIRVPLLIRGSGLPGGRRISAPVSLLDVMPTILELLGVPPPDSLDGSGLSGLWRGEGGHLEERYLFGEADHNNLEHDITRAVRHKEYKLHFNRLTEKLALFDLQQDPEERLDIAAARPDVTDPMMARLQRFLQIRSEEAPPLTLSPEEVEKLRSLGYIN